MSDSSFARRSQRQVPIIETLDDRVLFSVAGIPVQVFPLPSGTNFPGNLTVTNDGTLWYSSGLASNVGTVSAGGTVAAPISTASASSHGMSGLTVGPDGKVWFCEFWDNVIGEVNPDGQVQTYSLPKKYGPQSITLGSDGHLWITTFDNEVGRVNSEKKGVANVTWFKNRGEGVKQIVSWNNAMYIQETDTIGRITKGGSFKGAVKLPQAGTVASLAVGPDGNLWFTENGASGSANDFVGYVNTKGKVIEYAVSNTLGSLAGITRAGNGNLVFCQGEYLEEMTTAGAVVASQDLGLASGAGSVTMATDGNVWFAEGVMGRIGLATV